MSTPQPKPAPAEITLDPEMQSEDVLDFEVQLLGKIIGQEEAVNQLVSIYQNTLAGMNMPGRPISNLLFLGPTGSGKTRVVEASAEILFGSPKAFTKIDCAEFQHSHEIAKLVGSPPGYLGHRETLPLLTQEAINQYQTDKHRLSFLLFDEIEKANFALWQLLLGILDKATLTLGDNRKVDLSHCMIFMTSNLGAVEMSKMLSGGIGFRSGIQTNETLAKINRKMYRTALDVTRRKFSPEFMNRIDKVVVFQALNHGHLRQILDIELNEVQNRIMYSQTDKQFVFKCTSEAKEFLLREGTDVKYGARHLKRTIERHLVYPLSSLIVTGQINMGDIIKISLTQSGNKLTFSRESSMSISSGVARSDADRASIDIPRKKTFILLSSRDKIEVEDLLELRDLHVGDLLKLTPSAKSSNDMDRRVRNATKLAVVGFHRNKIVIQIDDNLCYTFDNITTQKFAEYYKVILRRNK